MYIVCVKRQLIYNSGTFYLDYTVVFLAVLQHKSKLLQLQAALNATWIKVSVGPGLSQTKKLYQQEQALTQIYRVYLV